MELLKDVSLRPKGRRGWPGFFDTDGTSRVSMRRLDCTPFGESGMALLVQVHSATGKAAESIRTILEDPNVKQAYFSNADNSSAIGIIITKNSPMCRAIKSETAFCKNCLINAGRNGDADWDVILEERSLESLLRKLRSQGISVGIKYLRDLHGNGFLTSRQDQVLRLALELGFFDFPKKRNMKKLASDLSISTAAFSESIRRAERKMIQVYYSGKIPFS